MHLRNMNLTVSSMVVCALLLHAAPARAQKTADVQAWDGGWAAYLALEAIPLADRGYVQASQDLPVVIDAPLRVVFDVYSNVFNALGLHPFLVGITPIRCTSGTFDFIAREDIPLPDGTVYQGETIARQRLKRARWYYDADTYDFPGIVTHQHITFSRLHDGSTLVVEHLTFEAPPTYLATAVQGGVYAHSLVQQGLKARIEAGQLEPVKFPRYLGGLCRGGEGDGD
jgi:hypothetical protein